MLMVVFGAGASYDSIPSRPPKSFPPNKISSRPPLADQLFDDRPAFKQAMSRFPRCHPIVPYLQGLENTTVERVLERLQTEAAGYPEGYSQLAAIRYYLQFMLKECERDWNSVAQGPTNYKTLLDQIERTRRPQEQVCLVTFNYDTMLESALPSVHVEICEVNDYIASQNYKLIKLHGSVDWAREVETPMGNLKDRNVWSVANELIDLAPRLEISQRYHKVGEYPTAKLNDSPIFPALAIPVENKSEYECPPTHLDLLRSFIPEVTKLLVIGWRAKETNFVRLLSEKLRKDVRILCVCGGIDNAKEVNLTLQNAGIEGHIDLAAGGFTELVVGRQADNLLRS